MSKHLKYEINLNQINLHLYGLVSGIAHDTKD